MKKIGIILFFGFLGLWVVLQSIAPHHGKSILDGTYISDSNYALHIGPKRYSLCLEGDCHSGDVFRKSEKAVYLLDFRNKIPENDKGFPLDISDATFSKAKGVNAHQGSVESANDEKDSDLFIWYNEGQLSRLNYKNGKEKRFCLQNPCFSFGLKEGGTYEYLFKYSPDSKSPIEPMAKTKAKIPPKAKPLSKAEEYLARADKYQHPPQHCRCANIDPGYEGMLQILSKYAEDNNFEIHKSLDLHRIVISKDDEKFSFWYTSISRGARISSHRRDPNLGQKYEDEIFKLIKAKTTLRDCGGIRVCEIQTDG